MKSIFEKIKEWIIKYQNDIILVAGVILISLLSFAMGYIAAKQEEKKPIRIENYQAPSTKLQTSTNNQDSNDQNLFRI